MSDIEHLIGNKRLIQFPELKEVVINNSIRSRPEFKKEKKEENKTLLEF